MSKDTGGPAITDRELLELAAKAAGIEIRPHPNAKATKTLLFISGGKNWNPLTDDGDALRLAVKLRIHLADFPDTVVPSRGVGWQQGQAHCSLWEPEGSNAEAATRRAITRAAAEVGKAMP